jgi:hypothetical protein
VCWGRSDPQRTWLAIAFRDEDTAHGARLIRSHPQFGRQFVQPPFAAVRLDVLEGLAVDSRCAVVGAAAQVGELQDVSSIHLVVQSVEPITGRSLRFGMQRRLELLNLRWRYEAHRQSPGSRALYDTGLELRPLPSAGITRRPRYCGPVRHPRRPGLSLAGVRLEVTRLRRLGLPVLRWISSADMPSPIPRWDHWFTSLRGV